MSLEVDDTNTHYAYTSGWAIEAASQQYGGTSHCTSTDGGSVTLRFRGKYIIIYATVPTSTSPTFSDYTRIDLQLDGGMTRSLSQRALPSPIYSHPIYESSGLPETDHTLTLTFVNQPNTTRFCLDRIGISSDIGSSYVPALLDPAAQRREVPFMKRESMVYPIYSHIPDDYIPDVDSGSFTNSKTYSYSDLQMAALTGAVFGGFLVALLVVLKRWLLRRKERMTI